jgi:hypothetical protein
VDLHPLDAEPVVDGAGFAIGIPVAEEVLVEVEREVGIDAERQGVVRGKALQLGEPFLVDPLLLMEVQPRARARSMASRGDPML